MKDRMKWFEEARFGMFIHWGVYAAAGRGEWVRSDERMPEETYRQYADSFHPDRFDPDLWAELAYEAGMRYAVMTAKHHDGFCMFATNTTDYNAMVYNGRDYVREFLDAFRRKGLKAGLYYSLIDWHHPDYPHFGDRYHPMRDDPASMARGRDFNTYLAYMHEQVRELCTDYGKLDILWLDFSYDDMTAEKWQGEKLVRMIRNLQPDVILNNRLEGSGEVFGSLVSGTPSACAGDFVSPEQIIPPAGITDRYGKHVPWEACITMNGSWGYRKDDHRFKSPRTIVRKLVECVSKGGNMLLNVGPDARGEIPEEEKDILHHIAEWMKVNGESVTGCTYAGMEKPEYGRITANGNDLYYHIFEEQIGGIPLIGINREDIDRIILLCENRELEVSDSWIVRAYPDLVFTDTGEDPDLPDQTDTVIKVIRKDRHE